MWEVLEASLAAVNLPYTVFLGLMLLYWLTVILGMLDLDLLHLDVEAQTEIEADVDTAVPGLGGIGLAALKFFHIGTVPPMILLSFLALSLWTLALLEYHYLQQQSLLTALLLALPNGLISLAITKVVTLPLRALFTALHQERDTPDEVIGKLCVVKTTRVDTTSGQAEVPVNGAPLLLNVRTLEPEVIAKGEEALVVQFNEQDKTYVIAKLSP